MPAFRQRFFAFVTKHAWAIGLVVITLVVCIANFRADVWLTGWDTLHPEFDFWLHLQRSFLGVWREDQGLGTLAAHSHMSDLPRILVMWVLDLVVPLHTVKFVYVLLCLVLGPLGIYVFLQHCLKKEKAVVAPAAFVAGLCYLFNLVTVQQFYVVFEMFAVQYAALGWLFYAAHDYVSNGKKKTLLIFALLSFLSAPMAYASLLWFAGAGALGLFLLSYSVLSRSKEYFGRTVGIGLVLVITNAFWLLPNLYFILSGGSAVPNQSHINEVFSQEAFQHNQAYGDIVNVALAKNFLFNWIEHTPQGFQPLLQVWHEHLAHLDVVLIGYSIFTLAVLGVLLVISKRQKSLIALFPVLFLGYFMLTNQNPPFTAVFSFIRTHLTIFEEGFRFPFTKFSLIYVFGLSVYFGYAVHFLLSLVKNKQWQVIKPVIVFFMLLLFVRYSWPMFTGHLINPKMRNDIPDAYFAFFDWSKTQPTQTRFALLPLETFSGWHYTNWNYEGPGFWWFGTTQPLLTRDFDRWSQYNETFYNQLSTALYDQNPDQFAQVLDKFDVDYILLDESIIAPGKENSELRLNEAKELLADIDAIPVWRQDFLQVYQTRNKEDVYLKTPSAFTSVFSDTTKTRTDQVYQQLGNYLETTDQDDFASIVSLPFADLTTFEVKDITYQDNQLILERPIRANPGDRLEIPGLVENTSVSFPASITYRDNDLLISFPSKTTITVGEQKAELPNLSDIVVSTQEMSDQLIVQIGDSEVTISKGQTTNALLSLMVNNPIEIFYFNSADVEASHSGKIIDDSNVISYSLPESTWQPLLRKQTIPFAQPKSTLQVSISNYQPEQLPLLLTTDNCEPKKQGTVSTVQVAEELEYSASDHAVNCATINNGNLRQDQAYLLRWRGENVLGRSLKMYVRNNANQHLDLEHLLAKGQFDQTFLILPWKNQQLEGYTFSWDTHSFGQDSKNILQSVELFPISLTQLQTITIRPRTSPLITNQVAATNIRKIGNYHYLFYSQNHTTHDGIFYLSQGFDPGWIAVSVPTVWWHLSDYKLLPHYRYNGWANAWKIAGCENNDGSNCRQTISVLYWPQLLSIIGYLILAVASAVASYFVIKNTFNNKGKTRKAAEKKHSHLFSTVRKAFK